jgi:chromosome segregation ATPase
MISVEQVHALEERVEKAVAYISELKQENAGLRRELEGARLAAEKSAARAAELESAAEAFRRDQASIEEGIVHALRKLDAFEDLVLKAGERASRPEARAQASEEAAQPVRGTMESRTGSAPREAKPATMPPAAVPVQAAAEPADSEGSGEVAEARAGKDIDELSLEELEAATAPDPAPLAAPATQAQSRPVPADPSQLDIF